LEALASLKASLTPSLASGTIAGPSRFVGMTPAEFEEALAAVRGELDYQVVMMLVASFEAVFQADLRDRVGPKSNDRSFEEPAAVPALVGPRQVLER
jgi:hypothetical protein